MEKIISSLIDTWTKGVDTYTHNGSTWLIFTDSKQWVIELTEDKTLWYNYNFFKQIFEFTSLDVVKNQHYITKWVEDNVMNKIYDIHFRDARDKKQEFEDTLERGVKFTLNTDYMPKSMVVDIIENGKIETHREICEYKQTVDYIIQTGVKETKNSPATSSWKVIDTLENGMKLTRPENTNLKKMVKTRVYKTIDCEWDLNKYGVVDKVIYNGIKETKHANKYESIGPVIKKHKIDDVVENGVKVSGTFVGGKKQKENIESVIGYGTKNPQSY
ncbi:MAG: hypothetical protein EBS55_11325 [Flavobacteriaceae bacterium]|nr:hypothetical protein [Flavobacteriaceae bacterium]